MQTLDINNFDSLNVLATTKLAEDAASGSAVEATVENSAEFAASDIVVVGSLGTDRCELTTVSSASGASLTLANLDLDHYFPAPVTKLFGDRIQMYRANNVDGNPPADGAFSTLGSPVSIVPASSVTAFTDANGGDDYWYKFTYFNGTDETSLADCPAVRGGNAGNYATLDEIRDEAGLTSNPKVLDSTIARKRQRAQNIINGYLVGIYTIPFAQPVPPMINTCCIMLAAGYLLMESYGEGATGTAKDGKSKIAQVIQPASKNKQKSGEVGMLDLIKMREIVLTDDSGKTLLLSALGDSYPNNDTPASSTVSDPNTVGGNRYFYIEDQY